MTAPRSRLRAWLGIGFALAAAAAGRAAPFASAAQVRAAFIFHFTQFVDWPPAAFPKSDTPFVIGIIGDSDLAAALAEAVRGERLGRHSLVVRRVYRPTDAAGCSILYVSDGEESLFRALRPAGRPILTVGESDDFIASGGVIEFFTEQNHVRLRISLPAARAASLEISSKLLRVAQVIPSP